jgi:hypothetical protein
LLELIRLEKDLPMPAVVIDDDDDDGGDDDDDDGGDWDEGEK